MHVIKEYFLVGMVGASGVVCCGGGGGWLRRRSSRWVTSPQSQFTGTRRSWFSFFSSFSSSSFLLATSSIALVASTAVTLP